MLFALANEDKEHLKRLNHNQSTVLALKKLFLNVATKGVIPADVQTLAAERIAIDIIQTAFQQLAHILPDSNREVNKENTT